MFSCQRLSKSFGGVRALSNVDLALPPRGVTAIVGPNGAGKTTLINILSGYQRADDGGCLFENHNISRLQPYEIARLGVARSFQALRLIQDVPTMDNVMLARPNQKGEGLMGALLGIGLKKEEEANQLVAGDILKFVGLEGKLHDRTSNLSYGQQKLVTLACCVASDAKALLLDEPVAGVDSPTSSRILKLLKGLGAAGKLVVMIEHDIEAVRAIADHIVVMNAGSVVAFGLAAEILDGQIIKEVFLG